MKPCARKQGCAQCIVLQVQTQNPGGLVELTRRKVCSHENAVFSANLLQVAEQLLRQLEIGTRWVPHTTKVNIWKFASQGQYEGVEATAEEVPFKGVDKVAANRFWFCWLYSLCWQNDFLLGFPQAILDCDAATAHQAVHKFNTTATSGCNACLPAIPFAATFEWPIAQKRRSCMNKEKLKQLVSPRKSKLELAPMLFANGTIQAEQLWNLSKTNMRKGCEFQIWNQGSLQWGLDHCLPQDHHLVSLW